MLREGAGQMGPGAKAGVRLPVLALGVSVGDRLGEPGTAEGPDCHPHGDLGAAALHAGPWADSISVAGGP